MSDIQNIAFERGKALYELKRHKEALQELLVAYSYDSNNFEIISYLSVCFESLGDSETALKFAKELVSKFPDDYYSYYVLSIIEDSFDSAITAAKKSLELEPTFVPTIARLASLYIQLKNVKDALVYIDLGLSFEPFDINLLIYKLQYFKLKNDKKEVDEAQNIIKTLLDAEPSNDSVHYEIAQYYCDIFRFEDAITHFKKAISLNPKRKDIRIKLAETGNKINNIYFFGQKIKAFDIIFLILLVFFIYFQIFLCTMFVPFVGNLKSNDINLSYFFKVNILSYFFYSSIYLFGYRKFRFNFKKWLSKYTTEEPGLIWNQDVYFGVPVTQKFSFMYVFIFLCNFICMFIVVAMVCFVMIELKIENNTESKSIILTTLSVAFLGIFVFPEILYFQYLKHLKFRPISKFNSKKYLLFFPIFIIIMKMIWLFLL